MFFVCEYTFIYHVAIVMYIMRFLLQSSPVFTYTRLQGRKERERESFGWAPTVDICIPFKRRQLKSLPVFVVTSNAPSTFEAHVHAHNGAQRDAHLFFHPVCIPPLLSTVFLFPFLKPAETTHPHRRVINKKKQKQMLVHPCNCAAFPSREAANYLFFVSVSSIKQLFAFLAFFHSRKLPLQSANGNCGSLLPSFVTHDTQRFSAHTEFPFFYSSLNFARTWRLWENPTHTKKPRETFLVSLLQQPITSPSKTTGFLIRTLRA